MSSTNFTRNRLFYVFVILSVIGLGLGSRASPHLLPDFIATYAGDTLWALMAFLMIGFIFPSASTIRVAIIALLFSLFIEVTQLYHAPWIDEIRHHRLAALILGQGFLWSDLVCYTVGVAIGATVELIILEKMRDWRL